MLKVFLFSYFFWVLTSKMSQKLGINVPKIEQKNVLKIMLSKYSIDYLSFFTTGKENWIEFLL